MLTWGGLIREVAVECEDDGFHLIVRTDTGDDRDFGLTTEAGMQLLAALAPVQEHHAEGEAERAAFYDLDAEASAEPPWPMWPWDTP